MPASRKNDHPRIGRRLPALRALLAAAALGMAGSAFAINPTPPQDTPSGQGPLPIIFVHGAAGSGAQYLTQAMRFASNGYPAERILAFEYNGTSPHSAADLDRFVDEVRNRFQVDKVHLVAHSMGTSVGSTLLGGYLTSSSRAAKVEKYIGIDGFTSTTCPGRVQCMGIFVTSGRRLGSNNVYFTNQSHVEVVTSAESFVEQYKFLTGSQPTTTAIVPMANPVAVSGRAVYFPSNQGAAGARVKVWPIHANTGHRSASAPVAEFVVGANGNWGPAQLDPQARYEIEVSGAGPRTYHYYFQPFLRDTSLVRLLLSSADSDLARNTNTSDHHATLVITRYKEWWGDRLTGNDVLEIGGRNVITRDVGDTNIALHIHDDTVTPGLTTLSPLRYFNLQPFQAGVDVFLPAANPPNGTISLVSYPRGDRQRPQVINVPNWASSQHAIQVIFNDWVSN